MVNRRTEGLIAAPFTPMRADRTLDLNAVDSYAHRLHANGVVGAFICGTTGEGMSLTIDERCALAERWVAAAPAGLRVIVHVGHNSLPDCRTLAAHAESIGADSIACLAPSFFKPAGVDGLVAWCEQVAAAAPNLPFYYYHMPSMTGVSVNVSEFLGVAAKRIATLAGVKFTFEDLDDYQRCLELEDGRFDVLFGRDELLLSALARGARGAVGSTYNFAAPLYQTLIKAYRRGDRQQAAGLQALAVRMIDALVGSGAPPVATFKWFMSWVCVDCGPSRLPLVDPTPEQIASLKSRLRGTGILDWVARSNQGPCPEPQV